VFNARDEKRYQKEQISSTAKLLLTTLLNTL